MYLIKITARSSFTRLTINRQIYRIHEMLKYKICYKYSVLPPSHLNLHKPMDWFLYDNGLCHERVKSSNLHFFHIEPNYELRSYFRSFVNHKCME